ncbi:PREDICTED: uncharacterized protein LOC106749041 isoform X2 [Dinoponera quadriceps]|uniref:Uncharacterized protein LOC106749041 isoform X2 n=1 Tax=Dinoponera quadriceps TaxID=609295 RepID=A0A6P3XZT8_DINQU|nr:PREDICTED: uncharacterized protein LOC106749041 isoform X2 [Dinoponera quadriceps]
MVSFKSNNVSSEQSTPHRHLPGTLRGTLNHSHNHHHHHHNHPHRHEQQQPPPPPPPSTYRTPPPPPPTPSYITVQRGCALHSRLDQPVTNSTPGMDNKKIVQSPTPPVPVQVRSKHDGSGVAASVSGVRRRSGPQGLRSPAAKRPLSAPVALQGWLHKQGSEGLMLWKKRWFVLSEYCLFYYKGPEEEKLLGSILLPSYRVTVCKPEDKVNKKFAFKAEHANMRTYHFAADSRESMNQWVNALTLATLLQDPSPGAGEAAVVIEIAGQQDGERSARPSVSSISSILNQSADDSDSGFHGFQSRDDPSHASNNNSSPNSANTASFPNLSGSNSNGNHASESSHPLMNGWIQQPGTSQPPAAQHHAQQYGHLPGHSHQHQALLHLSHKHAGQQPAPQPQHVVVGGAQPLSRKFGQPIYANAPPKPRRLTDGSNEYSTPSPDADYRKSPVSPDVTVTSKSPMSDYESGRNAIYAARINQPSQQSLRTDKSGLNYGYGQTQPTERRTPDTYGRSAKPRTGRGNGDYEEVYGTPQLYQRPAGPVGYTKGTSPAPIPIPLYAAQQQMHSPVAPPNVSMARQSRGQPPPRPHSADFLEYEAARRPQQQPAPCEKLPNQQRRPQRPKSSLDIVNPSDTTNDGYFYSEERYAAQMRQSAVYLHQTPQHYQQQQRNQSLSRVTMQPKLPGIRDKPDEGRISTLPADSSSACPALRRSQRDHVHQQHTMPAQSLTQRHSEIMGGDPKLRRSLREKSCEANGEDKTVPRRVLPREYDAGWGRAGGHGAHISQTCHAGYAAGGSRRWSEQQQQFCRSASARLPRTRHPAALDPDDDDYAERSSEQDSRDGERKIQQREESMKRLLEWKQRMLQSPLTRKPSGSASRGRAQNDLSSYYKQQALLDLAAHEAAVAEGRHSRRREDGHRSHVRSKSSDGRRTAAANVPRYNSYSSDDEELGDVRRKRTRRPSHAGRSPRHAGDDRSSAVQELPAGRALNARCKAAGGGGARSSLGGIPPDAGYDEVSFPPPPMRSEYAPAGDKQESALEESANRAKNASRKPLGILKTTTTTTTTSSSQQFRPDSVCGYRTASETWGHVSKNVQWDAKDDEWDPGIDESKVVKEFSYQYIKPKEADETMNLVQCRIRSFEMSIDGGSSPVREILSMQEPLKISPLQATEAHVSKLECANRSSPSVIRSFALGEEGGRHAKQASTDSNKSVKDLLANFERKSQQAGGRRKPSAESEKSSKERDAEEDSSSEPTDSPPPAAAVSSTESSLTRKQQDDVNTEDHYLPMSPRKAILDPNCDDRPNPKIMESLFANLEHEESSYVEMAQNGMARSLLAPNEDGKRDSGDYSTLDASHYEFVCVSDSKMEPVYMEVSQLSEKGEEGGASEAHHRAELPDILTALKSDSSDADDESSKDLDSIDAPRHPRFSLSDTFRPASYYLGASRNLIAELHDSSDSELVSPPPIPTSPPPLDDLDSLEMQKVAAEAGPSREAHRPPSRFSDATVSSTFRDSRISLESASGSDTAAELRNDEERHRRLKRRPVSDDVCGALDSLDEYESLGSRFDGASIDLDRYLEELQARDAFNVDLYAKDLSYNSIYGFNENMLVVDKLQKTTACQELSRKINLDRPFGCKNKTGSASSLPSMRVSDLPPSHQHSQSFTGDAHYENVARFSPLRGSPAVRPDSEPPPPPPQCVSHSRESSGYSLASMACQRPASARSSSVQSPVTFVSEQRRFPSHSRSASHECVRHTLLMPPHHRSTSSQDSSHYPLPARSKSYLPNEQRAPPSADQSGAPYYYSDLQANADAEPAKPIGHTSRLPQLNNQRDDASGPNKRNDIGRIVNPIARQMPRQIRVDDIDEARRIAAELRRTTCQLLADDKAALVDKRNFYEADTLRRVKSTDPLSEVNARNLYPHGLRDKSAEPAADLAESTTHVVAQTSHRRSRSLEGLLDDVGLQNLVEQRNRAAAAAAASASSQVEAPPQDLAASTDEHAAASDGSFHQEDPWEQDTLWFESLRRVSLRNARSLDNLDSPPRAGGSKSARGRITRGVTYVNDSVALRRDNCAEERPRVKRRTNKERTVSDEDEDVDASLSMERVGAAGYVWDPQNEAYHRKPGTAVDATNHFLEDGNLPPARSISDARVSAASFELDREKLRQWDLLSSACLLQEQQQQQRDSIADSGRGLPEHPGDALDSRRVATTTTTTTDTAIDNERLDVIVKPLDTADVRDVLPTRTMPAKKVQEPSKRAAASGSGSVIGRDPLPPRAVSTSHLPQRTLTQPPTVVSTLPLPRSSTAGHRQQPLPLHHSTPQHQSMRQLEDEPATSQMLRAASNGDIGRGVPGVVTGNEIKDLKLASPVGHSQRLISPVGHLRVASLNDHRVSSPSDSEIRVHSPSERKMISPISREVDRGGGATTGPRQGQQQRTRDCNELLHKRSNVSSQRADTGGRVTQAGASGLVRVSAGELLGRTHEELVLLLIQLRRQNATVLKAMETCHMEIEAQARLAELETPRRLENLQKLEELKRHLMDLEKQYEKSKPLVNLVDNMVKLGSLYNRNTANGTTSNVSGSRHDLMHENARDHRDRLEFNQRVQEQRLLAEERRDWDRLSPDHGQLQAKVQQLYKLDRLLQEESGTLHSLQQDKEILEKALGGLRHKLQGSRSNLAEAERYRKQQLLLERELSRVRVLLAHNSKKLEETVAENARLEQDLVVLRQKLQASRRYAGNIARDTSSTTAPLEAELRRVQQLVGDLQRQRKELSIQVRQLTEKSHSLVQQIRPQPAHAPQVHHPKKRTQNSWLETDLDSGITLDHGLDSSSSPPLSASPPSKHDSPHQRYGSPTQYKDASPLNRQPNQPAYVQPPQNHISALSPKLREQIQQHQLKQQLLKDQMQGKGSTIQVAPLYVNTDSRVAGDYIADTSKHNGSVLNGAPNPAPEYIPPPPPPPLSEEALLLNDNYRQNEDNKFAGLMHNREKQEIKTVRIVKRESERRQRDRGDRIGNLGIPLTNGLQAPGGAKRLCDDDLGGSQKFEKAQLGRVVEESPIVHAQSTVQLSELDDVQFQRSMSLPRGFGGQKQHSGVHYGPVVPPPRSDSMHALRSMMARRHKIRFESHDGSSDSTLSPYTDSTTSSSHVPMSSPNYSTTSSYSPSQNPSYLPQTVAVQPHHYYNPVGPYRHYDGAASSIRAAGTLAMSPELTSPANVGTHERPATTTTTAAALSVPGTKMSSESPQLSPVYKSEAAKQIIKEMTEKRVEGPRRRQIPREKRRHYTVSSSKPVLDLEDTFSKMGMGRARDDLDMERALRPRINAPDVVRSTLSHKELKYNESTIDQLLGTPNKIVIPERYIPEQTPELTAEEQEQRLKKAEAIRKMLSETTVTAPEGGDDESNVEKSDTLKRKVVEEKRQREHILQLNQILAKQVMEKSKMVAETVDSPPERP